MPDGPPRPSLTALTADLAEEHPEPYQTLRKDILTVLDAALGAVQPDQILRNVLEEDGTIAVDGARYAFGNGEGLHVLAVGRAAEGFAHVAAKVFPEAEGLLICPWECSLSGWETYAAEHPVPGETSIEAGEAALEFVQNVGPDERLLVLLSGGASALMEVPRIPLEDLQLTTQTLLDRGLTVHEMNMLRKHLSKIKGGQLAAACRGEVVTLALSDVPHDRPSDIGSGPTVPDPTTFGQTKALVQRIGEDNIPPVVVEHVEAGVEGEAAETPKPGDADVEAPFHILATNRDALEAGAEMARELGHSPKILPSPMDGRARVVGESLAKRLVSEGQALLSGGETTVQLRPAHKGGPGDGGRNQELTLAAALHLSDEPVVVAGFGTDGIDGPTEAAGAIADGRTLERAAEAGVDPKEHLMSNDSNTFFAELDDLIVCGPTGTNAMDVFVGLTAQS